MAKSVRSKPYLSLDVQRDLADRLTNIEGHIRGIRRMLEEHQSCDRILIQLSAIKAAVNQTSIKLLDGHIENCVKDLVYDEEGKMAIDSLKISLASILKS